MDRPARDAARGHRQLEHLPHRRFVKTHLPVGALVFSPRARYIYVGRDGRDALWSLHNHHQNANEHWYGALNGTPGLVGPPIEPSPDSVLDYYRGWFARDGYPFWSMWESARSWWGVRMLPNVMLVHFTDLKSDLPGTIRDIAAFLSIPIDESNFSRIVEHCGFAYMKSHAEQVAPMGGMMWHGGAGDVHPQGHQRPLARHADAS